MEPLPRVPRERELAENVECLHDMSVPKSLVQKHRRVQNDTDARITFARHFDALRSLRCGAPQTKFLEIVRGQTNFTRSSLDPQTLSGKDVVN